MNFDPNTEAAWEHYKDEIEKREMLDDIIDIIRLLIIKGEKDAAILFIERVFDEKENR